MSPAGRPASRQPARPEQPDDGDYCEQATNRSILLFVAPTTTRSRGDLLWPRVLFLFACSADRFPLILLLLLILLAVTFDRSIDRSLDRAASEKKKKKIGQSIGGSQRQQSPANKHNPESYSHLSFNVAPSTGRGWRSHSLSFGPAASIKRQFPRPPPPPPPSRVCRSRSGSDRAR